MEFHPDHDRREWLETDGRGGFASGTAALARSRRYHALLLTAAHPPAGRLALVNGFEAHVTTPAGTVALSTQRYAPGVLHPDGFRRIVAYRTDPWPTWQFRLEDGTTIEHEICVMHGRPVVALRWRILAGPRRSASAGGTENGGVTLEVRPLLSGRDFHALHQENPAFRFAAERDGARLRFHPYPGVPAVVSLANAAWEAAPDWYRRFHYAEEAERGFPAEEDLACPGRLLFPLGREDAVWLLAATDPRSEGSWLDGREDARQTLSEVQRGERLRRAKLAGLARAADAYVVQGERGTTVIAGYPWFGDWGRDTFIAMRGLCLATGRLDEATAILTGWAGAVSAGMLPNRFPDEGGPPEYNAVDAALWFVVAAADLDTALARAGRALGRAEARRLGEAIGAILDGYAAGTRHGIRLDDDGLLAAGEPGVQLTWMDARVGERVVTPRTGKPVEVEALWWNALRLADSTRFLAEDRRRARWRSQAERCATAFAARFWCEERAHLHDVVDADHVSGRDDSTLRPNQIFAVGGLPLPLLTGARARAVVDRVESALWTPRGLRSLGPGEAGYQPRYEGGPEARDAAYHQGTAWPWLAGAFVEAWVRTHGQDRAARDAARQRFLEPLLAHLGDPGSGHLPEIADGDPPHRPRGCPFQAWSVGEALRLQRWLGG